MSRPGADLRSLWAAYRARLRRRRLLLRALWARRALHAVRKPARAFGPHDILCFATMRNEALRLPAFLEHHRRIGVTHFLIVLNESTDASEAILRAAPDVAIWTTQASYRRARFGMDWINGLLTRYGRGRWCLTLDADEMLVYPHMDQRPLGALTAWLDARGIAAFSAQMVDLYPDGPIGVPVYVPGAPVTDALPLYDAWGQVWERHPRYGTIAIRGGARRRVFFADCPELAPHLNKTPLVRWHWRYAYLSSTHITLPTHLCEGFDARLDRPTGVLLHSKFLPDVRDKTQEDRERRQHFSRPRAYDAYHAQLLSCPDLRGSPTQRHGGWADFEAQGLMSRGDWV